MKKIVFLFFLMMTAGQLLAQSSNGVNVFEDPRIQFYMNKYEGRYQAQAPQYIYRIQLISTYNRDEANRTQGKFRNLFPNESSFLQHDGVKFLVRAGSFSSKANAQVFLQQLRKNFPSSFILPPEVQQ